MKLVQISQNDSMCEQDKKITSKNIRKVMRDISGMKKINLLYSWPYENGEVLCYGCVDGRAGNENKHDLPGSGKKLKEDLDNSDTQLLFNDIFLVRLENKKYIDFDVSDYGLFYTLCFEGFDECHSDDMTSEEEDDAGSLEDFIVDETHEDNTSDDSYELPDEEDILSDGYDSDIDELDEDLHEY